jgi:malonate decarboxylase gamma subunit
MMDWQTLAGRLFPAGHAIVERDCVLSGDAQVDGATVAVVGTTRHTAIGVEIALAQAEAVLRTVREAPGRPIVILVDTQGQRLRHRDEMLGINRYMAHLGKCIELARRRGHPVIGLVYDQALSGGFITSGLMADACHALPDATIRVMGLPAMARITKVPLERLTELAGHNPVFAPGPQNYLSMGGIDAIWDGDLAALLAKAIADERARRIARGPHDRRSELGLQRGGRKLALPVAQAVSRADDIDEPAAWAASTAMEVGIKGGNAGPA